MLERVGAQAPSFRAVPNYESSLGPDAIELAESAGLILDEWQQETLIDASGCREDGKWAAFEVGGMVSRQNGKGGILEARELAGLFLWGERLIIHSSHEFATSMEAFLRMEERLEGSADLSRQVRTVSRSHGSEGFVLKTGQRLRYRTRTKGGGRGFTGDTLILDEAMDLPEMFHGALLPTLSGRSLQGNPQVWYMGSAVDQFVHEHGIVFARVRERGLSGKDPSLAYFEWSVDYDTPDAVPEDVIDSEDAWGQANPGLGIRISASHIAKELRAMHPRTFTVERLGVGDWPRTDGKMDTVIPLETWDALLDQKSKVVDPVSFAFDVTPDRSAASIGIAGRRKDGLAHVEIIEHRRGTGWVVGRLIELVEKHEAASVVCDNSSPAAALVPELEKAEVLVETVSAPEHAQACGLIFDAADQGKMRHLGTTELRSAIRGAKKRPLGDSWGWSRKNSGVDISPLVAVTLALWATLTKETGEPILAAAWA